MRLPHTAPLQKMPPAKTNAKTTRVLIVEDSPTIQTMIATLLGKDPRISVVGVASDAMAARAAIRSLNPDVITLDIEMPQMDGLEFLRRLMRLRPMPVVMLSSLARRGRIRALEALSLGAVDCVEKPGGIEFFQALADLPDRLIRASRQRVEPSQGGLNAKVAGSSATPERLILMGASTGGVDALEVILSEFAEDCPPTLIVQHMAERYLENLVHRLDRKIKPRIAIAEPGLVISPGQVLLAPGDGHNLTVAFDGQLKCRLQPVEGDASYGSCVDALFFSGLPFARIVSAALLTGMGQDGARGLLALRRAGADTIAQDRSTSTVFGMPMAAIEMGAAASISPLESIAGWLLKRESE